MWIVSRLVYAHGYYTGGRYLYSSSNLKVSNDCLISLFTWSLYIFIGNKITINRSDVEKNCIIIYIFCMIILFYLLTYFFLLNVSFFFSLHFDIYFFFIILFFLMLLLFKHFLQCIFLDPSKRMYGGFGYFGLFACLGSTIHYALDLLGVL